VQHDLEAPEVQWRGLTWEGIASRIMERVNISQAKRASHAKSARRWQMVAGPLAWLTAVLAGLSGVSVLAETDIAVVLSIATALVAGTNAALSPAEQAKKHSARGNSYERMTRKFDDLAWFETEAHGELVPVDKRDELRQQLQDLDDEMSEIEAAN
jgi:hypothetical protein